MKNFACLATIPKSGLKTLSDGGIRVTVDTQEITPEQSTLLFQFKGSYVKFVLASEDSTITPDDIKLPDQPLEYKGDKSKSQVLRNCLYVLWEKTRQDKTFDEYYAIQMSKIIDYVKEKLG